MLALSQHATYFRAELWNAGFSREHVYLAGYYFAFLHYFSPMVKFLLAACKERCEDSACWYRSVEAAHRPLLEELVEEGPLEARTALCGTDSLFSGPLQCVPPVWRVRGPWAQGCACAAWGCCTPECCPGQVSVGWVTGSRHSCVPSPTAPAEVKGGSLLMSPRQNPVERSEMRGGGRSAAKEVIFLLWHLPTSQAAFTLCVGLWVCLGFLKPQLSALQCLQAGLTPHPWPSSSLSLSREQRRPWHSRDCDQWVGLSARSFQLLSHVRKGQVWLLARTWTGR